jgi:hypothetical protein
MASKTVCPITRQEFVDAAVPLKVSINGHTFGAMPRYGEDGKSSGYYVNGKITLRIGGKDVTCQVGLNVSVVGSKDMPFVPYVAPSTTDAAQPAVPPSQSPEVKAIMAASKAKAIAEELAAKANTGKPATAPAAAAK